MSETARDTRAEALQLLLARLEERRTQVVDEDLRTVLDAELVTKVFNAAWDHQFESNRTSFQRTARDLIQAAVTRVVGEQ